ncbi:uncharacterized protein [Lolium perenne]|uniref:uncharacterized protein n=1 Tax=Lolium perenne TaxID=4522 RepID=UPI003A99C6B2
MSSSESVGQYKKGFTKEVLAKEKDDVSSKGMKGSVGVASATMSTARPTMEEVIAFGGIPQPSLDVRTSARLGGQPDGDMSQMEKAMRNAQLRDGASSIGYPYGVTLGPVVGSSVTRGTAGCYGYWMHTAPDGRSGYLVPGWLAAQ